jgi:hypothetical protein
MVLRNLFAGEGHLSPFLHENYVESFAGSITFQEKRLFEVGKGQDRSCAHSLFQSMEGLIRCRSLIERIIFKESSERCYNFSIILNKFVIISY